MIQIQNNITYVHLLWYSTSNNETSPPRRFFFPAFRSKVQLFWWWRKMATATCQRHGDGSEIWRFWEIYSGYDHCILFRGTPIWVCPIIGYQKNMRVYQSLSSFYYIFKLHVYGKNNHILRDTHILTSGWTSNYKNRMTSSLSGGFRI